MLMVIQAVKNTTDNTIYAATTFLVAAFEAGRLNLLHTALDSPLDTIIWQEHWDPYKILLNSPTFSSLERATPKIMVEAEMRDFVSRSLSTAGFDVAGYGEEVEAVRQIKTKQEIEIMRAVNTGTVSAIREMRKCMSTANPLFLPNMLIQLQVLYPASRVVTYRWFCKRRYCKRFRRALSPLLR